MRKKFLFKFLLVLTITLTTLNFSFSIVYALDSSAPVITNSNPSDGAVVNSSSAIIKFDVTDPDNISDVALEYYIKVNGNIVSSNFMYDGSWVEDSYGFYYKVSTRTVAHISGQVNGLKDGIQNVEVMCKDQKGNMVVKQWSFTVSVPPEFSGMTPIPGTTTNNSTSASVNISDNGTVDPDSIIMMIDGLPVQHSFNPIDGLISYTAKVPLLNGMHTIWITAADMSGNKTVKSWIYTVGETIQLAFADDGKVFDTYKPAVKIAIKSTAKLSETGNVILIDGKVQQASFSYTGHWQYSNYSSTWIVDDYTSGTLSCSPLLSDGSHSLSVTAKDAAGNTILKTWSFSIAQKPVISSNEPTGTINSRAPLITASAADFNSPINKSEIKLIVDNRQVTPVISGSGENVTISFTPEVLTDDSEHHITLTVPDNSGNTAMTSWKFYVRTKQEMTASPSDCGACHGVTQFNKYKHSIGPDAGLTGSGGTCGHCHQAGLVDKAVCEYCHDGDPWNIHFGTTVPDPKIGANTDCMSCHGIGSRDFVQRKLVLSFPPTQVSPWYTIAHDVPALHIAGKGSCSVCHSTYLTREHNRVNKSGVQITCVTCHGSSDSAVRNAIATNNTDCQACHSIQGHDEAHISNIDSNCQTCHKGTVSQEHVNNSTTAGNNLTCNTCHSDTAVDSVKRSLLAGNLNCSGCHSEAHNINLSDSVPVDIPLYSGFRWSSPMEASLFTGEASTPPDYATGQVIISNRKSDIEISQLVSFYITQLGLQNWNSKTVQQEPERFALEFVKGNRGVVIKGYYTAGDGAGPLVDSGLRTEIWYK